MKPQIDESKVYTIGTDDGKVIEIKDTNLANGAVIQLWDEWDKPKKWQLWKFEKVGKYDDYRLINQLSGKMLDLIAEGTTNGSWAHQWERTDAQSQIWFLQPTPDGKFKIMSKPCGRVLDIVGLNAEDGARLQIWDDVEGDNQHWILTEVDPESGEHTRLVPEVEETPKEKIREKAAEKKKAEKPAV